LDHLVATMGTTFVQQNPTVPVGSTVTWLRLNGPISQYDDGTHNMDFGSDGVPLSSDLAQWGTWAYTFTQAGTYPYICDTILGRRGTIVVTP
jgi:plastocyanin